MIAYTAEWILPMAGGPVRRGSVVVENGRIAELRDVSDPHGIDLGHVVILPALVNAHTHLELSHLRGAVPHADHLVGWVRALLTARRQWSDPADARILAASRKAIAESRASGTGLIGDISNSLVTVALLHEAGMPACVFHELLGFNTKAPEVMTGEARARADAVGSGHPDIRVSVAPHAPYSVSPGLFTAIRADIEAHPGQVSSVHLGESPEEVQFISRGTGPWRTLLEELCVWNDAWKPAGVSPVAYLDDLGFLDRRVLAVHGVQFVGDDLDRLRALDMTVVACPRSNVHVGVGAPPLEAFYAGRVHVAFGTDSLASASSLSMFDELAEARRIAPRVPARALLESATYTGARALGFGDEMGTIEAGKRACLIAVDVPVGVGDVEEYLVGGIKPDAVRWIDAT